MGHYEIAQICENGHLITDSALSSQYLLQDFCSRCGAPTTMQCSQCGEPIHGRLIQPEYIGYAKRYVVPRFCWNCGVAYPWTAKALAAAKSLASEFEGLTEQETQMLSKSIDDLVAGGPQTEVAAIRFKKAVAKLGKQAAPAFREILIDVVSEAAKKQIWGS